MYSQQANDLPGDWASSSFGHELEHVVPRGLPSISTAANGHYVLVSLKKVPMQRWHRCMQNSTREGVSNPVAAHGPCPVVGEVGSMTFVTSFQVPKSPKSMF
eukprot:s198_g2.t1